VVGLFRLSGLLALAFTRPTWRAALNPCSLIPIRLSGTTEKEEMPVTRGVPCLGAELLLDLRHLRLHLSALPRTGADSDVIRGHTAGPHGVWEEPRELRAALLYQ